MLPSSVPDNQSRSWRVTPRFDHPSAHLGWQKEAASKIAAAMNGVMVSFIHDPHLEDPTMSGCDAMGCVIVTASVQKAVSALLSPGYVVEEWGTNDEQDPS